MKNKAYGKGQDINSGMKRYLIDLIGEQSDEEENDVKKEVPNRRRK